MTIEEILQKHFVCKKPFLKKPKPYTDDECGTRHEYMTQHGSRSYSRLVVLIYDLESLGVVTDANHIIETLDNIVSGKEY